MERLLIAIESLIKQPDASRALDSAMMSIGCMLPRDFPTKELANKFSEITEKVGNHMEKLRAKKNYREPRSAHLQHLRFVSMNGRQKHWLKENIWSLFYDCYYHNLISESSIDDKS